LENGFEQLGKVDLIRMQHYFIIISIHWAT